MNLVKQKTVNIRGTKIDEISVEVQMINGIPDFKIVGLVDKAINEAKIRVKGAIINSGYKFPNKKIIVNLYPSSLNKSGTHIDLAIAIGILRCSQQINIEENAIPYLVGELSLSGDISISRELFPVVRWIIENEFKNSILPFDKALYNYVLHLYDINYANNLKEVIAILNKDKRNRDIIRGESKNNIDKHIEKHIPIEDEKNNISNMALINPVIHRCITISLSGKHSLAITGTSGVGKSFLFNIFNKVLCDLESKEALEVFELYSRAGLSEERLDNFFAPPIRRPSIDISKSGFIGGGTGKVKPGEISLAHKGIMFIDEFTKLSSENIDLLCQVIDNKEVNIFRNGMEYTFLADILLILTGNNCMCGNLYSKEFSCTCTQAEIDRFNKNIKKPFVDRIDLWVNVERTESFENEIFLDSNKNIHNNIDSSNRVELLRDRIHKCRKIAKCRGAYNGNLKEEDIQKYCFLGNEEKEFLNRAYNTLNLSHRGYLKTIKVARTIADLEDCEKIKVEHLGEALSYRGGI